MALRYDSVDTPPNAPVAPAPTTTPVLRRRAKAAGAVATSGHAGRNCRPHPGGSADRQLGAARGVAVPRRPDGTARPGGRLSTLRPQGAARGRGRQPWGPGRTMGVRPRLQHGTTLCPQNGGMAYLADSGNTWEHLADQYAMRGVPSKCSLLVNRSGEQPNSRREPRLTCRAEPRFRAGAAPIQAYAASCIAGPKRRLG